MWLSDIKFVMLEMFPETQVSIIFYFGHRPLEILFQIFCVDSMFVYTQKRNIERMQMKKQKINYQVICFCQWFLAGKKVFIFYMMLWWGICFYPLLLFLWTFCKMQLNFEDQMSQKSIDRCNLIEDEKQLPWKWRTYIAKIRDTRYKKRRDWESRFESGLVAMTCGSQHPLNSTS